jgi:hypothetical protein
MSTACLQIRRVCDYRRGDGAGASLEQSGGDWGVHAGIRSVDTTDMVSRSAACHAACSLPKPSV